MYLCNKELFGRRIPQITEFETVAKSLPFGRRIPQITEFETVAKSLPSSMRKAHK